MVEDEEYVEEITYTLTMRGSDGNTKEMTLKVEKSKMGEAIESPAWAGYYAIEKTYTIVENADGTYGALVNYGVDSTTNTPEVKTTGTTAATGADGDAQKASIAAGGPGIYTATQQMNLGDGSLSVRPSDTRIFRWNTVHAQADKEHTTYTFTIDKAGEQGQGKLWKESMTNVNYPRDTKMVFYVQMTSSGNSADAGVFHNKQDGTSGTLKTSPVGPGDYCYQIEVKSGEMTKVIQSGTFTIEPEGLVAGDKGATGITKATAEAMQADRTAVQNKYVEDVKALDEGVYVSPEVGSAAYNTSISEFDDVEGDNQYNHIEKSCVLYTGDTLASDCRLFVYTGNGSNVTLTIYVDGAKKYEETTSSSSTSKQFFLVQLTNTPYDGDTGMRPWYNSGTWEGSSPLAKGTECTYTLTTGSGSTMTTIQQGTFSV